MHKVKKILEEKRKELMGLKNVVGVGAGYKHKDGNATSEKSIIILVNKKLPEAHLETEHLVPKKISGIPTDVLEIGNIRLHQQTQRERPAHPGVSIGNFRITAGTFGAVVRDNNTGELLILSNNHVLANATDGQDNRSSIGDAIVQPGTYDGGRVPDDTIANLIRFNPVIKNVTPPQCQIAKTAEKLANFMAGLVTQKYSFTVHPHALTDNLIDAALAKPVTEDLILPDIHGIGFVKGAAEAEVGMEVQKSGRTTGVTTGTVKAISVSVDVNMDQGEVAYFTDQILTGPISQPGDSGSLVLDMNNNAVGLLFAGSDQATICNRIQNVLDLLEVELVLG